MSYTLFTSSHKLQPVASTHPIFSIRCFQTKLPKRLFCQKSLDSANHFQLLSAGRWRYQVVQNQWNYVIKGLGEPTMKRNNKYMLSLETVNPCCSYAPMCRWTGGQVVLNYLLHLPDNRYTMMWIIHLPTSNTCQNTRIYTHNTPPPPLAPARWLSSNGRT